MPGRDVCRWHSKDPADKKKVREEASRGGKKKPAPLATVSPLAELEGVPELDLKTAEGLCAYLAHTLHALGRLPFDTRCANAIGQLATAQRVVVEKTDLEQRMQRLESLLASIQDQRTLRAV